MKFLLPLIIINLLLACVERPVREDVKILKEKRAQRCMKHVSRELIHSRFSDQNKDSLYSIAWEICHNNDQYEDDENE